MRENPIMPQTAVAISDFLAIDIKGGLRTSKFLFTKGLGVCKLKSFAMLAYKIKEIYFFFSAINQGEQLKTVKNVWN